MKIYYDFHLHSCLSPCGDNDMTPQNICNMIKLMGFNAFALTDHNTCKNCPACKEIADSLGLIFIPGMELTTSEEVHIVCLFHNLEDAMSFSDYVYGTLPPVKNKPDIFGEQLCLNSNDRLLYNEEKLLITASTVSAVNAVEIVGKYNGICFPAHIDRSSFSIISNLGSFDDSFGFNAAEIYDMSKEKELKEGLSYLNDLKILSSSDAHYLENIRLPVEELEVSECSIDGILASLS
ncbi:MAG: PHP domain-containing protein [Acutalibacteraceae bacterium]